MTGGPEKGRIGLYMNKQTEVISVLAYSSYWSYCTGQQTNKGAQVNARAHVLTTIKFASNMCVCSRLVAV